MKSRDVICAQCPDRYPPEDIVAFIEGDEQIMRPMIDLFAEADSPVLPAAPRTSAIARLTRPRATLPRRDADGEKHALRERLQRNREKLKEWKFRCPQNHIVDGNPGTQFVLSVIGAAGSSKSHVLPGLLWEADTLERLGPLGIALRKGQYSDIGLEMGQRDVFQNNMVLDATDPEAVNGPYGYRLSIANSGDNSELSLLLFDVGGEAVSNAARIGEVGKFVLLSDAIIYLLDPDGAFSTAFDRPGEPPAGNRQRAAVKSRLDAVDQTADALARVWGEEMNGVAFIFAIAKADAVEWAFPWKDETSVVLNRGESQSLREALVASSLRVREALVELGAERIVNQVERRFPSDSIRFVALSATSQMPNVESGESVRDAAPEDKSWDEPTPEGVALALLHALDVTGEL